MTRPAAALIALVVLVTPGGLVAADLPSALVDPYLQVQVLLAGDKFDGVAQPAKQIETAAAALGPDGEKILAGAKKLAAAKNIESARAALGEVSQEIAAYAEKTKSGFGADVRLAYCPMVDKPWLQKGTDLKNPYYGASMLTCGTIKK